MKTKWIITVGREFCSGGSDTGREVASILDIPYYDKEIIDVTVATTELERSEVEFHDERPVRTLDLGNFQYANGWYRTDPSKLLPTGIRVADAQFKVIRQAAQRGSCVIMGRCGDYALEEFPNVLHVFIRSSMENRVQRAQERLGLSEADAIKLIRRTDKARSSYYNYYTQRVWGDPANYDLIIDAGRLGTDAAARIIANYVENNKPSSLRQTKKE